MTFREQGTLVTLLVMLVVYGWYFFDLLDVVATVPVAEIAYQPRLLVMIGVLVALMVIGQAGIAILHAVTVRRGMDSADASDEDVQDDGDERDRMIEMRGDAFSGYIVALAAMAAMFQLMANWQPFWAAHTLLAGLVLSEIAKSVRMLILYRRGF